MPWLDARLACAVESLIRSAIWTLSILRHVPKTINDKQLLHELTSSSRLEFLRYMVQASSSAQLLTYRGPVDECRYAPSKNMCKWHCMRPYVCTTLGRMLWPYTVSGPFHFQLCLVPTLCTPLQGWVRGERTVVQMAGASTLPSWRTWPWGGSLLLFVAKRTSSLNPHVWPQNWSR